MNTRVEAALNDQIQKEASSSQFIWQWPLGQRTMD